MAVKVFFTLDSMMREAALIIGEAIYIIRVTMLVIRESPLTTDQGVCIVQVRISDHRERQDRSIVNAKIGAS